MTSVLLSVGCGGNTVDLGHADDWADLPPGQANAAAPQTLFESHEQVFGMTTDDTTLYALITRGNTNNAADSFELVSCPIEACKSQRKTLYSGPLPSYLSSLSTLSLVDGSLFWLFPELGIASCSARGCSELALTPATTDALASDGQHVYWLDAKQALMRLAPRGEGAELVRSFSPLDIKYVTNVSARGSSFLFVNDGHSVIYRIGKDGLSDPEPFVMDEDIASIAVSGEHLYYSSRSLAGRIAHCDMDDCANGTSVLAEQQRWPGDIRIDDGEIFWMNERPLTYRTQSVSLASCALADCANIKSWSIDFELETDDGTKLNSPQLMVNHRYVMWVARFVATSGSAVKLVPR